MSNRLGDFIENEKMSSLSKEPYLWRNGSFCGIGWFTVAVVCVLNNLRFVDTKNQSFYISLQFSECSQWKLGFETINEFVIVTLG